MTETSNVVSESKYKVGEPPVLPARSRSGLFAAILSFFVTGLGQVYAGQPGRGLVYWLCGTIVAGTGLFLSTRVPSLRLMFLAVLFSPIMTVVSMIDAWRVARRASPATSSRLDRWPSYVVIAFLSLLIGPHYLRWLKSWIGQAYKIPSRGMEPTLLAGDFIMTSPIRATPRHDEMIVYRTEHGPFVKRIAGLPHDTIEMHDGVLIRNGESVKESYRIPEAADPVVPEFEWQRRYVIGRDRTTYRPSLQNWGPLVVPAGDYFILGDNRGNSLDSRYMGFTPRDSLWLAPRFIYFSWSYDSLEVRWHRIGIRLD